MGPAEDPSSVVDDDLFVLGVEGVAVVDASIIPIIPRAGTNLTAMMIGERAGQRLLASAP
jgi:choline dehydrogenase